MENRKGNPLLLAILVALFIAFSLTAIMYMVNNYHSKHTPSIKVANKYYEKGEPEKSLNVLNNLPNNIKGQSGTLYKMGQNWYLKAWKEQSENHWKDYGKDPQDWFKGESVDKALHFFKEAQRDSVYRADATFYIALIYMQKGWYQKSTREFKNLFKLDPRHKEGILNYAVLLSREGKYREAEQVLLDGIKMYPDFSEYYKNLFWLYDFYLNEPDKAVSFGDRYKKLAPKNDFAVLRVNNELIDLLARYPELKSDTLLIVQEMGKKFVPRRK